MVFLYQKLHTIKTLYVLIIAHYLTRSTHKALHFAYSPEPAKPANRKTGGRQNRASRLLEVTTYVIVFQAIVSQYTFSYEEVCSVPSAVVRWWFVGVRNTLPHGFA